MLNYKQIWHGIKSTKWLIKFNLTPFVVLYFFVVVFAAIVMQMTPTKKKTIAKKGEKRLKMDNSKFRSP